MNRETITGSVVQINAVGQAAEFESLIVGIEPKQNGSGTTSPSNVRAISGWTSVNAFRAGENLAGDEYTWQVNASGVVSRDTAFAATVFKVVSGKKYTVKASGDAAKLYAFFAEYPRIGSTSYNGSRVVFTAESATFTAPTTGYCVFRAGVSEHIVSVNEGETATEAPKDIVKTTAGLGRTVYGGTLDLISGELTVTKVMVDLGSFTWVKDETYKRFYTYGLEASIAAAASTSTAFSGISDSFRTVSFNAGYTDTTADGVIFLSASKYVNIRWLDHASDTVAQFKTAVTGKKLVYELATPQTYTVAATSLGLSGLKNVWADSGDIEATWVGAQATGEAVMVNGKFLELAIDGYTTVKTSGREGLSVDLDTFSVGSSDGETIKGSRYPAREIEVEFVVHGDSLPDMRKKLTHLNNILSVDDADFVFADEPDVFYTGKPVIDESTSDYKNAVKGKWKIYCAYPFKRSVELTELTSTSDATVGATSATFQFNYNGSYPARPILRAEFAAAKSGGDYSEDGDCGFVAFLDADENIIQLGNPDVIDLDQYNKNATLINSSFDVLTGWTASNVVVGSISDTFWNKGTGQTQNYAKPSGTASLTRTPSSGAVNYEFDIVHRLCVSDASQTGTFEVRAKNGATTVVGILISKNGNGTSGKVTYILNGNAVGSDTIDLSYYNKHFGYCQQIPIYTTEVYYVRKGKKKIKKTRQVLSGYDYSQSNLNTGWTKNGSTVTFSVGELADRTFKCSAIASTVSTSVVIGFSGSLNTNAVHSCAMIQKAGVPFAQIPNVFTAGDIVEADCNDANVVLYRKGSSVGHLEPQYGALGNDWEDFRIMPGTNVIRAVWSPWVNTSYKPTIKIIFNEVYL